MKTKRITPEMAVCLADIHDHGGVIRRHAGGFWRPGSQFVGKPYGATTINALVKRGRLEFSEWKGSGAGVFPIEAKLPKEPRHE